MAKMNEQKGTDEILAAMKVGDTLRNKRTFRAMKDSGIINDYSSYFGVKPYEVYAENENGNVVKAFAYFGRKPKDGEVGYSEDCPMSYKEWHDKSGLLTYHGYRFVLSPMAVGSLDMELRFLGKVKIVEKAA